MADLSGAATKEIYSKFKFKYWGGWKTVVKGCRSGLDPDPLGGKGAVVLVGPGRSRSIMDLDSLSLPTMGRAMMGFQNPVSLHELP